jgi:hypothetical protein
MKYWSLLLVSGLLAGLGVEVLGGARQAEPRAGSSVAPIVLELFTSEGCSSCPPADEWLRALAAGAEGVPIIALSEHVDYWNRLGWKDPYSSAAMTARQQRYARSLGADVYTPQMVVDGASEHVGSDRGATSFAIRRAAAAKKAEVVANLAATAAGIDVAVTIAPGGLGRLPSADVFVALTEDGLVSNVAAGENAGRRLAHSAVVRYFEKLGPVKKDAASTPVTGVIPIDKAWDLQHSRVAVLLQERDGAKILGAWSGLPPLDGQTRLERR